MAERGQPFPPPDCGRRTKYGQTYFNTVLLFTTGDSSGTCPPSEEQVKEKMLILEGFMTDTPISDSLDKVMRKKKWECFGEIRCDINNEQNLKGFGMSTSGTENAREERDKAQDIQVYSYNSISGPEMRAKLKHALPYAKKRLSLAACWISSAQLKPVDPAPQSTIVADVKLAKTEFSATP
ncbi:predicted protein [Histoplasma capsulatum G186AR]|uniref:Uncharacterized protein n=1 Tax=Ajellomyces capsulatus (strain G186AR / H82 / ATCC MYA-2454 / RMSCC 2432) TaxID=447093 RepID=C0NTJ0_AJECG|nr:uncharacterized protein HCBG_06470 [Histoplasma capsulatum G186AR]EEH05351.1 predicted protein [Histoplasma capsulatum G186AR]